MTLNEAIDLVLAERPGQYPREVAQAINERALYTRGDRQPVPPGQVTARVGSQHYRDRYRKDPDGRIYPA